ncbi:MAG: 50S ribosomal protein L11 methyltransferase [Bryobacterales bacterium]|nr:50S ribosomal protein L11 methyltransferase [Bryobacterales bacterium]
MHSLSLRTADRDKDLLVMELWDRGTTGVLETELPGNVWELRAFFDEPFDASSLSCAFAEPPPAWRDEGSPDWETGWQRAWEPLPVGRRLLLLPAWMQPPPGHPDRLIVLVHPGQASGSGYHAPTQLALLALETYLQEDDSVLDVGAGTGILLAAAAALGARTLFGCEIDRSAAAIAQANLAAEGIPAHIWTGSPRSLAPRSVSLIAANLNGVTLDLLLPEFARVLRPGGRIILSGFTERWRARLAAEYAGAGFQLLDRLEQERWRALVFSSAP